MRQLFRKVSKPDRSFRHMLLLPRFGRALLLGTISLTTRDYCAELRSLTTRHYCALRLVKTLGPITESWEGLSISVGTPRPCDREGDHV